jgi:serine/threonine protein kinase
MRVRSAVVPRGLEASSGSRCTGEQDVCSHVGTNRPTEDLIGERVAGKYEIRRLLGSGAMGTVYECVHVDLGKRLAIKLIRREHGESASIVERFRREARAASAVESDYIVQTYDFGRDDHLGLYMVIEYLDGEDLDTRLVRERWIGDGETAVIGMQLGRGLARAHAAGVIHRDLKPANVFLTRRYDGRVLAKILDFGISKVQPLSDAVEPTLTAHGTVLGTPQYMSPEQCEGMVEVDGRTDVWSLAAIMYEMLAGEPAVPPSGGPIATMERILREDIPPLATRAPWVNADLAHVIDSGLARDRDERTGDAATFAVRLQRVFPDVGSLPSFEHVAHATDVSELGPQVNEPAVTSDPEAVMPQPAPSAAWNPATARTRSEGRPSCDEDDEDMGVFVRGSGLQDIRELPSKKTPR